MRTRLGCTLATLFVIVATPASAQEPAAPTVSFGGQYRINAYTADDGFDTQGRQTAARLRLRQDLDLDFGSGFTTHLQAQLNHVSGNQAFTSEPLKVRHAVLDYVTDRDLHLRGGLVPLSDRFGETLFSSEWDFSPLALAVDLPLGPGGLRVFAGNLAEGIEVDSDDDIVQYQGDYDMTLSEDLGLTVMGGVVTAPDGAGTGRTHAHFGAAADLALSDALTLNGFIVGSRTDGELLGTADDGSGVAIKAELIGATEEWDYGVMVTHASGGDDGSGFLPVMSLIGFQGYWGYTGILTVQGPTDTGFDGDAVNVSNNGYGLTTVQGRFGLPLTSSLSGMVSAGWFGNTQAAGRDGQVGIDLLLMATQQITDVLALDFGLAGARLDDGVSGYTRGAAGGFNQGVDVRRDKWAAFLRLQAEY